MLKLCYHHVHAQHKVGNGQAMPIWEVCVSCMKMCIQDNITNILIFSNFTFYMVIICDIYASQLKGKKKIATKISMN